MDGRARLLGAVAALALAGCGDEETAPRAPLDTTSAPSVRSAEHDAREAPAPTYTEPGGAPIAPEPQGSEPDKGSPGNQDATGGKVDIAMRGRRFVPEVIPVHVSQIVVFTDEDDVPHTVRALHGLPHSGLIPPGGRFEYTALRPGTLRYRCVIHAGMTGMLEIRP
jgi:plastocyanin